MSEAKLNIALPDGHLMVHMIPFIKRCGLHFEGYDLANLNRRPKLHPLSDTIKQLIPKPENIAVKVIRPQDMPTHIANSNFDMAISGTDWLAEHLLRFPKSPAVERLRLGFGKVRIVAAVHEDNEDTVSEFIRSFRSKFGDRYLRIASEYMYIADHFAQQHRLHPYRIIMTYGATESLIPEDCDIIIENTETGGTLRKNRLKIIETLDILGADISEACIIANSDSLSVQSNRLLIQGLETVFRQNLSVYGFKI